MYRLYSLFLFTAQTGNEPYFSETVVAMTGDIIVSKKHCHKLIERIEVFSIFCNTFHISKEKEICMDTPTTATETVRKEPIEPIVCTMGLYFAWQLIRIKSP